MNQEKKVDPFQYMILKKDVILQAVFEEPTYPKAWNALKKKIPEIKNVIRFNTFKVYARILVKFGQVIDEKETELDKVRQEIDFLKTPPEVMQKADSAPRRFKGWGVQLNRGYYRLFKKIDGRVKWIYIGKKWDNAAAAEKISVLGRVR
ncbi:Uncharacterized protein dnl_64230 [Desulfonema limicola]|uniref:Uncharacterized protein n=1 Tax=Desulfonema limicola TaxID=45656 RepID=A0A975B2U5_9BACT|nr:hypothetical protein [Desulfonema limicola]QTA77812.1 Uncharacterized protein dnl_00090 [Desulfonema limicola]QTA77821.1 Uncharacterized protein dnl_00180 [Desulfonema limicola]QTA77834.1 Uncharacterized protein dnl_00310 [Desulfonema limicola]QTA82965.1 Uncharacterized protein dnl_53540 [Desulfonema limicola]QTA83993.1 Uncharacterized protein dnl_64230 [Desulfonema limicola]